jgi:hypothetical protein
VRIDRADAPDSPDTPDTPDRADDVPKRVHGTLTVDGKRHKVHADRIEFGDPKQRDVRVMGPVVLVDGEDTGIVRVFADAEVQSNERVEGDVVAVFGSVTVRGQVSGNVVAVFGNVDLAPGASVEGDAVAVGGLLKQPPGATVSGQSVSLGFLPLSWGLPALPLLIGIVVGLWLVNLFFGWVATSLFPQRMLHAALTSSRRTGLSLFLGMLSLPLLVIAIVLLIVTVIGIPVAVLLPIFFGALCWAGKIAASYVLGCKLMRRAPGSGGMMGPIAAGTGFVSLFFVAGALLATGVGPVRSFALFFDLLGLLLLLGLTTIGTGAFLVSKLGAAAPGAVRPSPLPPTMAPGAPAAPVAGV